MPLSNSPAAVASELRNDLEPATLRLLSDYNIHHSAAQNESESKDGLVTIMAGVQREPQPPDFDSSLAHHPVVSYPVTNPAWWPRHWRRVPDYRPINRELDVAERQQKMLFFVVGGIMVWGCCLVAVSQTLEAFPFLYATRL